MAEIVGLVASVVTVSKSVVCGINLAKTMYSAAEELQTLQDQLQSFSELVCEIDHLHLSTNSTIVESNLVRAKLTINQICQIIQVKLLRNIDGTQRAKRRSWARHKSKLFQLGEVLKECRSNLLLAISANNSSSSSKLDSNLAMISREINAANDSLAQRLGEIHNFVAVTYEVVASQAKCQDILNPISSKVYNNSGHPPFFSLPSSQHTDSSGQPPYQSYGSSHALTRKDNSNLSNSSGLPEYTITVPQPAGLLECSANFYPEAYWLENGAFGRRLRTVFGCQESISSNTRTNFYSLYYFPTPREYVRIMLHVTIFRDSSYWEALKAPSGHSMATCVGRREWLPEGLYNQVQSHISKMEAVELEKTSRLNVYLSNEDGARGEQSHFLISASFSNSLPSAEDLSHISFLHDLDCPRYIGKEIVHIGVLEFPIHTVFLNGELIAERIIHRPSAALGMDPNIYNIKLLHSLNGSAGIPKFYGIVTSQCGQQLKSYLMERLGNRRLRTYLVQKISDGEVLPWARREKWAMQIIQTVKNVHSKGFVVGTLGFMATPIVIDKLDNAMIWEFANSCVSHLQIDIPPECSTQSSNPNSGHREVFTVTSKIDIYQMGLTLWLLAMNLNSLFAYKKPFCEMSGCREEMCNIWHKNLVLPPLPDDIPEYYREIVTSCRLEHPIQRPSARELLDKLLAEQPHYQSKDIPNVASDDAPDPGRQMRCNICQSIGLKHYYHCDTCDGADYDICHKCFGKGLHCLDPSHFILEYFADSESAPGPYFSSVKSSGQRIAMHL